MTRTIFLTLSMLILFNQVLKLQSYENKESQVSEPQKDFIEFRKNTSSPPVNRY